MNDVRVDRGQDRTRAQTTIDFAIGMGVFLLATTFVVLFVPDIFVPFQGSSTVGTADRVAASLATDKLGDPATPFVLNAACTTAFFEGLTDDDFGDHPDDCRYDTTVDEPAVLFGLENGLSMNVTVEHLDGGVATIEDPDESDVTLAAGPTPVDTQSVTSGRRVVSIDDEPYRLVARVW
ncbi:DUF7287 family protein [Halorarum salinum]|uniref:Uncharacterized protein n=1 Tax=Halorarum salinum TaxID=2743089 RepID=A0A7D5QHJ8_9EURY|nr:hypothetical protein [Halobaculum salinum]QLG62802.1 hypothetical protein HUG12_14130 [Halobaculum salinum]